MNGSAAGFLLFLVGALALAGFLTGNLDTWLAFLFSAGGDVKGTGNAGGSVTGTLKPAASTAPAASGDVRGQSA